MPDSDDINKNFGFSLYTEFDSDDEIEMHKNTNVFAGGEGDTNQWKEYFREL